MQASVQLPTIGRPRQAGSLARNHYCCFGSCFTRVSDGVEFLCFPKPCLKYQIFAVPRNASHIKNCEVCTKCQRWVLACQRTDGKLQTLNDVTARTYICIQHFAGRNGPTEEHPNPLSSAELEVSLNYLL